MSRFRSIYIYYSIFAYFFIFFFFFSSRRRHTRWNCDWSSDVCSSDLGRRHRRDGGERRHARPHGAAHAHVRARAGALLCDPGARRRALGPALRHGGLEPLGTLRGREPPAVVWPCHAGRVSGDGSAAAGAVGRRPGRRIVSGGIPARRHVRHRGGAVRRARVRGGADVRRDHALRAARLHLLVRVFAGDDGGARRGGCLLGAREHVAALGRVDGVGEARCGGDPVGDGGVLLRTDGKRTVMRNLVRGAWCVVAVGAMLAVAAPGRLLAQDDEVGITVGATPPATTIEDLNGAPVDLSRWVGKKPVLLEFWATWC